MKLNNHAPWLVLALIAGTASSANAQYWNLGSGVTPYGISGNGGVVTGYNNSQYFMWTPSSGPTNIGGVHPNIGGGTPDISSDGQYISGTAFNAGSGLNEMSRYSVATGQWTNLGGIGGSSGDSGSSGWGISGDGNHVVGLGWVNAGSAHAIQWTSGGSTVDLGSTVAGSSSRANAVNHNGTVVGGWQDDEFGFRQGAVWNNGVQTLMTDAISGEALGEVSDVSADGLWAAGVGVFSNNNEAWLWSQATGGVSLGRPAGSAQNPAWRGSATAMSDDAGTIIGFYRPFGPPTFGQGFIWTSSGGIVELNSYVASLGIDTGGVTLSLPLAISADGTTIAGIGSGGVGWVVKIPTPGATGLFAIAGIAAARRRRSN